MDSTHNNIHVYCNTISSEKYRLSLTLNYSSKSSLQGRTVWNCPNITTRNRTADMNLTNNHVSMNKKPEKQMKKLQVSVSKGQSHMFKIIDLACVLWNMLYFSVLRNGSHNHGLEVLYQWAWQSKFSLISCSPEEGNRTNVWNVVMLINMLDG